jgi:hypothetical protein
MILLVGRILLWPSFDWIQEVLSGHYIAVIAIPNGIYTKVQILRALLRRSFLKLIGIQLEYFGGKMKGSEMRRIREKLGLSRDEFATIFGLAGYQSVMNIETDFRRPSKLTMILLRTLDALPLSKAKTILELLRKHAED